MVKRLLLAGVLVAGVGLLACKSGGEEQQQQSGAGEQATVSTEQVVEEVQGEGTASGEASAEAPESAPESASASAVAGETAPEASGGTQAGGAPQEEKGVASDGSTARVQGQDGGAIEEAKVSVQEARKQVQSLKSGQPQVKFPGGGQGGQQQPTAPKGGLQPARP